MLDCIAGPNPALRRNRDADFVMRLGKLASAVEAIFPEGLGA